MDPGTAVWMAEGALELGMECPITVVVTTEEVGP